MSASLADQLATVRLVERRMLYATIAGLAIALVLGFVAATIHARRIRRLQRAADRIAQGHFDEPIVDRGDDELGQLATAFDRMRVEVAQLDSARKEFVANASHELRTPLFSLSGFLELLADEDLDEETRREFLTTTRGQVERLTKLATDLLDLSRMDAGRLRIESEEVELTDTARLLAEELHALRGGVGAPCSRSWATARPGRRRTRSACSRSAGRWRAMRSCTRPGARTCSCARSAGGEPGEPVGRGRRPRDPGRAPRARLPALLPGGGSPCLRQRARAGDRTRAGRADGWSRHDREQARPHGVHGSSFPARRAGGPVAHVEAFPRGNGRMVCPGYSGLMRPAAVAATALVAAFLGGALALALGAVTGLTDGERTTVLVAGTEAAPTAATTGAGPAPLLGNRFDPAAIYAGRASGVVTLYADLGPDGLSQGSGFVVDAKGTILTNAHVVTNVASLPDGASSEDVTGAEQALRGVQGRRSRAPARIVGWDLFSDVAVVRVDPADHALAPVPLGDSDAVVVGTPVAAIGSPFNEQSSLSVGVVSAVNRSIASLTSSYNVAGAIQTDAPINRGNSGGPLFDARGRVIGINAQIRSNSGTAEGVGFAIPIDIARRALDQLTRTGRVSYAYIGITTQDVTPGLARRFGFSAGRGALVSQVEPDTPAAKAGIRGGSRVESYNGLRITLGGDLIVRIGRTPVASAQDVSRAVTLLLPGQQVQITLLRAGKTREVVQVTLAERPATP